MARSEIRIKRVYEKATTDDGVRVLVDRLWPRGLSKAQARIDHWFREIAPSKPLREWFNHDPEKWTEFQQKYHLELEGNTEALEDLLDLVRTSEVTLLFAAKDEEYNNAVALRAYLLEKLSA